MRRVMLAVLLCAGVGPACGSPQKPEPKGETTPEKTSEPAASAAPEAARGAPTGADGTPQALSEEDQRLIAADPATLSQEERRARAYALRRKIMLDPDSEAAKTIKEGMEAIERGELQVPAHLLGEEGGEAKQATGPVLSAPAPKSEPAEGAVPLK